jgi:hypothetical protein
MEPIGLSITLASVAAIVSLVALWFTYRAFALKSGVELRGQYSVNYDKKCDDVYVSSYTLENLKDKSAIIFSSYLLFKPNVYIELERFDDKPLLLKPFETYVKEFDPIDLYTTNLIKVNVNELFRKNDETGNLVVSTSDGKYVVKNWIRKWTPFNDIWKNRGTIHVQPKRFLFDGKAFGSRALYVVRVIYDKRESLFIPIYKVDVTLKECIFDKQLTEEAIESKESLWHFLKEAVESGKFKKHEFEVIDLKEFRSDARHMIHTRNVPNIMNKSHFRYYTVDKVSTSYHLLKDKIERVGKSLRKFLES